MATPQTILVTGFEPFPSAPENPTADLVAMIQCGEVRAPSDAKLFAHVLPVTFEDAWPQLQALIQEHQPDAVVSFGLSAKATGFTLEQIARNEIKSNKPDNAGFLPPPEPICSEGGAALKSGLPLGEIKASLERENLPVTISDDAGGYVCNHLFFNCMNANCSERPARSGFVHVPYLKEQRDRLEASGQIEKKLAALSRDELKKGVEVILKVLAS